MYKHITLNKEEEAIMELVYQVFEQNVEHNAKEHLSKHQSGGMVLFLWLI